MALHKHQCGDCRHVWEHEVPNTKGMDETTAERFYADGHMCPLCKNGPWFERHFEDSTEKEKQFRSFVREQGAPDVVADLILSMGLIKL